MRQDWLRRASFVQGADLTSALPTEAELHAARERRAKALNLKKEMLIQDALADMMQEVFVESQGFIITARALMADYAHMPTQPLRRTRLKINPQNHVRVLTFLYVVLHRMID